MDETERIKQHYKERQSDNRVQHSNTFDLFIQQMKNERETIYKRIISSHFTNPENIKIMEIGAGSGTNLPFFNSLGIPYKNIFANELIDERSAILKEQFPDVSLFTGDALALNFKDSFHIVFQSTVFTSILDGGFKKKLAAKVWDMVQHDGIVLWYDFKYNNPKNKSVQGIGKREIQQLFPLAAKIDFYSVTLAPPIGRRFQKMYKLLNSLFPFLRTHIIAVIYK